MRAALFGVLSAAALWAGVADAQSPFRSEDQGVLAQSEAFPVDAAPRTLIGREVRKVERDAVLGVIQNVLADGSGDHKVLVWMEAPDRTVVLDPEHLRMVDRKFYLAISEDQLAGMPEVELPQESAEHSRDLPHGGLTPGWGFPQGETGQGR